jgi:hypothetical protein
MSELSMFNGKFQLSVAGEISFLENDWPAAKEWQLSAEEAENMLTTKKIVSIELWEKTLSIEVMDKDSSTQITDGWIRIDFS